MISPGILMAWVTWLTLMQCQSVPPSKEMLLYGDQKWYLEAPSPVQEYEGRLQLSAPTTGPGNREHHIRLIMKESAYWIYDPDQKIKGSWTKPVVHIEGKLVTDSTSGILNELWPGRMWVE